MYAMALAHYIYRTALYTDMVCRLSENERTREKAS